MIKYKKAGEPMSLPHILQEICDMLVNDMEGLEVVNCYNSMMMDQIVYLGDDHAEESDFQWRKVSSHDKDGRH